MSRQSDCLFCRIVARELPGAFVYEDEHLVALKDIHPKAPVHVLIVPKKHIAAVTTLAASDEALAGKLLLAARAIAEQTGVASEGYRLVVNAGTHGGQVVEHLHMHLLGGKPLGQAL